MSEVKFSKLQIVDPKYWSGMTREEHFAWMGENKTQMLDERLNSVYELNYGDDNLVSLVDKFDVHEIDEDVPYRWKLIASEERNIPLKKASMTKTGSQIASTDKAGYGFGEFYLWFPEQYFGEVSNIVGENPEKYQVKVKEIVPDGLDFRYKVQLQTGDNKLFVPYEELAANTRWKELFAQTEQTLSERGNSVHHASNYMLENTLSMIRKDYFVPGNMITKGENPAMGMNFYSVGKDGKPKKFSKWINKLDWDFYTQFRRDKGRLFLYGKSNKDANGNYTTKGESGNTIRSGFGLYEQMDGGNLLWYTTFSLKMLTNFAQDLSVGKLAEDSRKFILSTGERGASQFHEQAQEYAGTTWNAWSRSGHNWKDNGTTIDEAQITKYRTVNGIEFIIVKDPQKDDPIINTIKFKDGLASSYTYDLWDIGTENGESNIKKVMLKGQHEAFGYIPGLRDPYSPGGKGYSGDSAGSNRMMATAKDGYSCHKAFWGGIMIRNVKRTGRIKPAVLQ